MLPEFTRKCIEDFFNGIKPVEDVYQNDSFSYLAIQTGDHYVLVQGTLYLNTQIPALPIGEVSTGSVKAGHFLLRDAKLTRMGVVEQLCAGGLTTPTGELQFPPNKDAKAYGAQYHPFHEIGLKVQRRLAMLTILGDESTQYLAANQPRLDWELRASPAPYHGIQELLDEFQTGVLRGVNAVDIAAIGVATIDASSTVDGKTARVAVRAATDCSKEKLRIGVRILDKGRVVRRDELRGPQFSWRPDAGYLVGTMEIPVPQAAVLHAFAVYGGVAQHHYFFADPASFQNARRAAYEAFDPKLQIMLDILAKTQGPRPESKDFEAAIPWLFWMLGFAPAFIGGPPRMRNSADSLLCTPSGNIAVVECTIGLLKEESKLPKLHLRTEAVRRNLTESNLGHVRVLPVIVTSKTATDIRPDLEQAEKLGVYVIAKEGLERLIERTLLPVNTDALYEEAEQAVRDGIAKHEPHSLLLED